MQTYFNTESVCLETKLQDPPYFDFTIIHGYLFQWL